MKQIKAMQKDPHWKLSSFGYASMPFIGKGSIEFMPPTLVLKLWLNNEWYTLRLAGTKDMNKKQFQMHLSVNKFRMEDFGATSNHRSQRQHDTKHCRHATSEQLMCKANGNFIQSLHCKTAWKPYAAQMDLAISITGSITDDSILLLGLEKQGEY